MRLAIRDDGVGGVPASTSSRPGHLGLVGMRERALAIGATLTVHGEVGRGTIVGLVWTPADEPDLPDR